VGGRGPGAGSMCAPAARSSSRGRDRCGVVGCQGLGTESYRVCRLVGLVRATRIPPRPRTVPTKVIKARSIDGSRVETREAGPGRQHSPRIQANERHGPDPAPWPPTARFWARVRTARFFEDRLTEAEAGGRTKRQRAPPSGGKGSPGRKRAFGRRGPEPETGPAAGDDAEHRAWPEGPTVAGERPPPRSAGGTLAAFVVRSANA